MEYPTVLPLAVLGNLVLVEKRGHIHERPFSASRCSKFRIFLCCWRWPLAVRNKASLDGCWIIFGARGWRWSMMIGCFWFSETGASCRRSPMQSIPSLSIGFNAYILKESFTWYSRDKLAFSSGKHSTWDGRAKLIQRNWYSSWAADIHRERAILLLLRYSNQNVWRFFGKGSSQLTCSFHKVCMEILASTTTGPT